MTKLEFKNTVFVLSEKLFPMVSRILGAYEKPEDAIQEIMIKIWQKRDKLKNHPNINGFIFLTARNYCLDLLRKKNVELYNDANHLKLIKSKDENTIEWYELNKIILEILKTLPEQQRDVFLMRDIDGYEFTEIASALNIKQTHARVLISRARKQIGDTLLKTYDYEKGAY
ncbi:MAG: RNA polymerase sigma factor [Winogradskyella sp.]|uniref:RNA polymerase sigma factor n=1 Tax=Winogradskyella sp. TaxID=1883156 RepID=UPI0017E2ECF2|nr:RNA polymerase sigma factor [Winogradskyella sp.]MBT8243632.1 RNA polymerase sigma factor [Winogradskyella sp.]NNK22957.1 RNA polymerase sigma factor [Winogradskyella sp.]